MMIGRMKAPLKRKEKKKTVRFSSFGEKSAGEGNLFPSVYVNCDCREGVLRGGIGLQKCLDENGGEWGVALSNNTSAKNVFFATQMVRGERKTPPDLYVVGLDGYLYVRDSSTGAGVKKALLGEGATHCVLKDESRNAHHLFSAEKGVYGTIDGETFTHISPSECISACLYGGRYLLLHKRGDLHYTAPFAPYDGVSSDYDGAGNIYLPAECGEPVGMLKYGDEVYIFFERGIYKLTVSAFARENTLQKIPYQGGDICVRGQAVTNDGILFLASDGLYYLRNGCVQKICEYLNVTPCEPKESCNVGYCDDLVLFTYRQKTESGEEVKRLAVYADGKDGYFTEAYGTLGGNQYTYLSGAVYSYVKDTEGIQRQQTPCFTSQALDFGTEKRKRLKSIRLTGEGNVGICVRSGEREHRYLFACKEGGASVRAVDIGKAFTFELYLDVGAAVRSLEVQYITEE